MQPGVLSAGVCPRRSCCSPRRPRCHFASNRNVMFFTANQRVLFPHGVCVCVTGVCLCAIHRALFLLLKSTIHEYEYDEDECCLYSYIFSGKKSPHFVCWWRAFLSVSLSGANPLVLIAVQYTDDADDKHRPGRSCLAYRVEVDVSISILLYLLCYVIIGVRWLRRMLVCVFRLCAPRHPIPLLYDTSFPSIFLVSASRYLFHSPASTIRPISSFFTSWSPSLLFWPIVWKSFYPWEYKSVWFSTRQSAASTRCLSLLFLLLILLKCDIINHIFFLQLLYFFLSFWAPSLVPSLLFGECEETI